MFTVEEEVVPLPRHKENSVMVSKDPEAGKYDTRNSKMFTAVVVYN